MRRGEVALWHCGTIVWHGSVGATINDVVFDAVSINVEDGGRFTELTDRKAVDAASGARRARRLVGLRLAVTLSTASWRRARN